MDLEDVISNIAKLATAIVVVFVTGLTAVCVVIKIYGMF